MAKKDKPSGMPGYGWGYVVPEYGISQVEGKLLTLVETMGLKESQESAVKGLIRQTIWEIITDSVGLSPTDHIDVRTKYKEIIPVGVLPMSASES